MMFKRKDMGGNKVQDSFLNLFCNLEHIFPLIKKKNLGKKKKVQGVLRIYGSVVYGQTKLFSSWPHPQLRLVFMMHVIKPLQANKTTIYFGLERDIMKQKIGLRLSGASVLQRKVTFSIQVFIHWYAIFTALEQKQCCQIQL